VIVILGSGGIVDIVLTKHSGKPKVCRDNRDGVGHVLPQDMSRRRKWKVKGRNKKIDRLEKMGVELHIPDPN
jgi:hypothetical protein